MDIEELIIKDVRCFAGEQRLRIRPLTFLVGENSTGKTTAFGCFQVLQNFLRSFGPFGDLNFNTAPYQMGTFLDISRKIDSENKKSFALGFKLKTRGERGKLEYLAEFVEGERGAEPALRRQRIITDKGEIILDRNKNLARTQRGVFEPKYDDVKTRREKRIFRIKHHFPYEANAWNLLGDFYHYFSEKKKDPVAQEYAKFIESVLDLSCGDREGLSDIGSDRHYSFGPIRSQPQRTYDSLKEAMTPDCDDIPMALRRIYRNKKAWKSLEKKLVQFGENSGLFSAISVKEPLGHSMADPFQLLVTVRGVTVNLMDAGYGVSQILPILVRLFVAEQPATFLIQQSETHLYPRVQAELTSLLVELIKDSHHQFFIETHSDFMIDRVRIEIKEGNISPDDVSLIYLEPLPSKYAVKGHNIEFDEQANLENVPDGYRDFFSKETNRLLGWD
ncbi:MAG: AAA family ATPase [Gammaproteobacteria bacterium AqS3]|nr:AAA family ATPase [Gammaproteobacteria bacterium AqS3]